MQPVLALRLAAALAVTACATTDSAPVLDRGAGVVARACPVPAGAPVARAWLARTRAPHDVD
jgi:hypothetical protein